MSLNPSKQIAAANNPSHTVFPNLARRIDTTSIGWPDTSQPVFGEVDDQCAKELAQAEIENITANHAWADHLRYHHNLPKEVPTKVIGGLCGWKFERAWYYWVATGPGIPADKAEEFHAQWGKSCRVNGDCGCPSPLEVFHGFGVGCYHIDTQEGLVAFAQLLRSIDVRTKVTPRRISKPTA
jgi:hypothetical protein